MKTLLLTLPLALTLASCVPQPAKAPLRKVDDAVQLACEGMAQLLAERAGSDVQRVVATSCAVEAVTRTMRELLLSEQIRAARAAGVAVPNINSARFEEPVPQAAE